MNSIRATTSLFCTRRATVDDASVILRVHVDSIRRVCSADYTSEQIERG
jgi:hypothetical protein